MNCPVCNEPMIVLELDEVEIDHCISCGGIWLDSGELELLLGDSRHKDRLLASFELDLTSKEKARKCPICLKRMQKVLSSGKDSVRIDRCKKNHGLWFDVGELESILASADDSEGQKVRDLLNDIFGRKQ